MDFVIFLLQFLIKATRKLLRGLVNLQNGLAKVEYDKERQQEAVIQSTQYDMVASPDEPYYRAQYWHWIGKSLQRGKLKKTGNYLDIGCGQGRMAMPLAAWAEGGKVTGVDFSERAIAEANQYAKAAGMQNIDYIHSDILAYLSGVPDKSLDAVTFLEVSFFMPGYQKVLAEAKRALKPAGLLFVSFRSQYFDALCAVKNDFLDDAKLILEKREGRIFGAQATFTWQTSHEIRVLMEQELGMEILDLVAVGACSGIEGDPHSFARPSLLDDEGRKQLMDLEIGLASSVPDGGRYMLCISQKK